MANNIGIIDQNYRGDIIVALRKVNKEADEIQCPCKIVQLIPKQWIHITAVQCDSIDITTRGDGGFGSTN